MGTFDNTKYDVEINGVGHRIKGYKKSEANAFVPRLGSGDQTESEFDLLRSTTLNGFAGGMLQRNWDDDTSVYATDGLYPKFGDGVLYSVNEMLNQTGTGAFAVKMTILASLQTIDGTYVAYLDNATSKGKLIFIGNATHLGTDTAFTFTLPTGMDALFGAFAMVAHAGYFYFCCTDGASFKMYYSTIVASPTITEIAAGTGVKITQLVSYKGSIYGCDNAGVLYHYTGDLVTQSWVAVGNPSTNTQDVGTRLFVYNQRITITRCDGMWAYDTVTFSAIDDLSTTVNYLNYRCAVVFKGYIHFWMPDGFYRYNGALIEKLYDSGESGIPIDMQVAQNRIIMLFCNSRYVNSNTARPFQYNGSSRLDIATGNNFSAANTVQATLMYFNGVSLYGLRSETYSPGVTISSMTNLPTALVIATDSVWIIRKVSADAGFWWTSLRNIDGSNSEWSIYSSIFDAGFPQLIKSLENVEGVFDGDYSSDYSITVYYRTSGFEGSGSWSLFGTMKMVSESRRWVFKDIPAGLQFQRIQLRFQSTDTDFAGLAKFIIRTSLMPDYKFQWQFTVLAYGDDPVEPLVLADASEDTQSVSTLRGNIYASRDSKVPITFVDFDQLDLNGSHTNSVTTITLNDTKLLKASGFVKIESEIIYYAAKSATTLTGCIRASLGTAAASHADNSKVFPCYRVVLRQLLNELIEPTDKTVDQTEDKNRASDMTILLQEQ